MLYTYTLLIAWWCFRVDGFLRGLLFIFTRKLGSSPVHKEESWGLAKKWLAIGCYISFSNPGPLTPSQILCFHTLLMGAGTSQMESSRGTDSSPELSLPRVLPQPPLNKGFLGPSALKNCGSSRIQCPETSRPLKPLQSLASNILTAFSVYTNALRSVCPFPPHLLGPAWESALQILGEMS